MYNLSIYPKKVAGFLPFIFLGICLCFFRDQKSVLLYTVIDITIIALGIILMLIALTTIKLCKNSYFHFLAITFGIVSILDLVYILMYWKGNIPLNNYDKLIEVSILTEYYECIMLNLSIIYVKKQFYEYKKYIKKVFPIILAIISIMIFKVFLISHINEYRLTLVNQIGEYLLSLCLLIILFRFMTTQIESWDNFKSDLSLAIFFKMLSSFSFTLCNNVNGIFNLLSYLFKVIANYYVFKVMFHGIAINPYTIIFNKLKNKIEELERVNKKLHKVNCKVQSMQEINEKFINLMPDGILIFRDKKIQYVNDRFLDMLEIDNRKSLENKKFIELIDGSYIDIAVSRVNKMDEGMLEKPQQYELVWGTKRKWVEVTSLIVEDEYGECFISVVRDIEDRKKAEEAEQLLELKKKEEIMKNEFFSNISHELRTPINVIYSALQVGNSNLKNEESNNSIVKYNKIIRQNCLRLIRLINNIIDITRIETSFFKPNYKIENIVSVVEDITMSIVEYIKSKNMHLIFDTEIEEAYVKCDFNLIERIMLNLLSNAVKYGKDDGNIEVYISIADNSSISISVKDDGIGIPEEMQQKIFDRFLKVDNSLSRKAEGSGIGLFLVKEFVEIHKGSITCESELNKGTEFKITLPTEEYSEVYSSDNIIDNIKHSKNEIKSVEIEFSDIY